MLLLRRLLPSYPRDLSIAQTLAQRRGGSGGGGGGGRACKKGGKRKAADTDRSVSFLPPPSPLPLPSHAVPAYSASLLFDRASPLPRAPLPERSWALPPPQALPPLGTVTPRPAAACDTPSGGVFHCGITALREAVAGGAPPPPNLPGRASAAGLLRGQQRSFASHSLF